MSMAELLVILLVAVLVFGPKQLPMLAEHLGVAVKKLNALKEQAWLKWDLLQKEAMLKENERRAAEADVAYKQIKDVDGRES